MKIINILILSLLLFSCKTNQKDENIISKNTDTITSDLISQDTTSILPVGVKELTTENLNSNREYLKSINLFEYYENLNSKLKLSQYNSLYKPTNSDILVDEDIGILKSDENYQYFDLIKIFSKNSIYKVLIYNGYSITSDYDGNEIKTKRKDLIVFNNQTNTIIDEMNLYYDYTDGIIAKSKLFLIDKNLTIFTRYYIETEEGGNLFSKIRKFIISENGKIKVKS